MQAKVSVFTQVSMNEASEFMIGNTTQKPVTEKNIFRAV